MMYADHLHCECFSIPCINTIKTCLYTNNNVNPIPIDVENVKQDTLTLCNYKTSRCYEIYSTIISTVL